MKKKGYVTAITYREKREALAALKNIQETEETPSCDCETNHADADGILLSLIDDKDIEDAYDSITKWYA